ncbi:hypothetical protein I546_0509 [Mycobacterium kansasii 732]|nr:hypothetical protein I546_0509 [Mycobacterium kansasii 732]
MARQPVATPPPSEEGEVSAPVEWTGSNRRNGLRHLVVEFN